MGHQRLGEIPKSKKWAAVVETVTGEAPGAGGAATLPESVVMVADVTLDAAEIGHQSAVVDTGCLVA